MICDHVFAPAHQVQAKCADGPCKKSKHTRKDVPADKSYQRIEQVSGADHKRGRIEDPDLVSYIEIKIGRNTAVYNFFPEIV